MDVVTYYAPLIFCLALIPVYLTAREFAGNVGGILAVFFMTTMVSTIYWHKVAAFDRDPTITLVGAWSFFLLVKLFKATKREDLFRFSLLAGMGTGLLMLAWTGAFYMLAAVLLAVLLVLFIPFGGKLVRKFGDVYGAVSHAIRSHFNFLVASLMALVILTALFCLIAEVSPAFWEANLKMVLGYIGINLGGGGGVSFPRYASEMQAPTSWNDVIGKFYGDGLLTNLMLLATGITLILCVWKRGRHHLLLLSLLVVLMALVWPGKGQARFERVWWPYVAIFAGVGAATLLSWLKNLSFDPSWEWLRSFQRPLLSVILVVSVSTPFLLNAYAAAERVTPPTEWRGRGVDAGFVEAFDWVRENTSESDIFSVQWSFGHLFSGATGRMSVCDGCEVKREEGKWENDPTIPHPPDYIYRVAGGQGLIYGVNEGARPYAINGRRPDVQWFPYSSENELRWYLKTYRDEYGVKIDYILFTMDEFAGAWSYYNNWQPGPILLNSPELRVVTGIFQEGNRLILNFGTGREQVIVDQDAQRAYLEKNGTQQDFDGFAFLIRQPRLIAGRRFDYSVQFFSPRGSPQIDETVLVFVNGNRITSAKLVEGISDEVGNREVPVSLRGAGEINFLSLVFESSNGFVKIYRVDHSVIT
jgi:hypothetical protein